MSTSTTSRIVTSLLATLVIGCATSPAEEVSSEQRPLVVFLVRHGEKADLSRDAELSEAGLERAAELAKILRSAEIEHVHTTDYVRTKDTATPAAKEHGLELEVYNPRDLAALAKRLQTTGGRHLVVGHSTTTPAMVELLGGEPNSKINEGAEFDRLYVVMVGLDGTTNSVMMRYGKAYAPEAERKPD